MARGLIARKLGMSALFRDQGHCSAVTILHVETNRVIQIKTKEKDDYEAVQLGTAPVKKERLSKAQYSRQKGAAKPCQILKEFRDFGACELGQEIGVDMFQPGDKISVCGLSKAKGFQGVMKRHGFRGGRASHGSGFHRAPGSLNASAYPSRVFKGKELPGRMGGARTTIHNLEVMSVDKEAGLLFVRGSVPGPRKSCLRVQLHKAAQR